MDFFNDFTRQIYLFFTVVLDIQNACLCLELWGVFFFPTKVSFVIEFGNQWKKSDF